jgi:hypothetical protein
MAVFGINTTAVLTNPNQTWNIGYLSWPVTRIATKKTLLNSGKMGGNALCYGSANSTIRIGYGGES